MTPYQKTLLDRINAMKKVLAKNGPYTFTSGKPCSMAQYVSSMKQLARSLCASDDRTRDVIRQANQPSDAIGRSRSCAFGSFERDDE